LQAKLGKRSVSMAALQMFFSITMRLKPAEEAIGSVDKVMLTEREEREKSSAERKASEEEKRKAREEEISGRPARRDAEG